MQSDEQKAQYQRARLSRDARFDGRFFVAVKTTGIFCRPVCPANLPKEENVEYFELAHLAMQQGYRPCLRCRPDSAPSSWVWKGTDTTVERGIKLLKQHPELSVLQIAEKLGVSDRYFRDLFKRKVGISPKQYQLFEQTLFAKQLLHQTALSVEQVALASGFQSARRLQENLGNVMKLSPSQIRKSAPDNMHNASSDIELKIKVTTPYNWPQVRSFLELRALNGIEVVTETSYARTIQTQAGAGYFKASFNAQTECFDTLISLPDYSELKQVVTQIRRVLDSDTDSEKVNQVLCAAGLCESEAVTGLRLPGVWNLFEAGCRAILGQQVSVKAAINLLSLLVEHTGVVTEKGRLFPTPEAVALSDLSFLRMPNARREALRAFAQYFCDHADSNYPDDWISIKGIGVWTIAYAKMRGLSQPDVFLASDLIVKKQLAQRDQPIDTEACRPWRSYLTLQLWSIASANQ